VVCEAPASGGNAWEAIASSLFVVTGGETLRDRRVAVLKLLAQADANATSRRTEVWRKAIAQIY